MEGIPIKTHLGLFICFEENPHYCSQYGYMEIDDIVRVDEETLCQYTGLTDKNGNKIWENDIVLVAENVYSTVKFGLYHEAMRSERTHQGFYLESMDRYHYREELGYWAKEAIVEGNIFDNSELLQEESHE